MSTKAFGDGIKNYPTCHCLVEETMTMCESSLTTTYLEISGASSCECIGIARCIHYNQGSSTHVVGKSLVIC